jgi:sialate O-acetylesterase
MKNHRISLLVASVLLCNISPAFALFVPHVFGDHMVLQAGMPVPVWGWAEPGEEITVRFAGQEKHATAGEAEPAPTTRSASPTAGLGRWQVELDPLKVSAQPGELTISGKESVAFKDVLVGEVWLCSGQSNMQKPVGTWRGQPVPTIDSEHELAEAKYPLIRLMNEEISNAETPSPDIDVTTHSKQDYPWKGWVACTPASLDEVKFSAVGYFFARKLFEELNVPIGMIEATAGGTHIEGWTPASGFAADPALVDFVQAAQTPKVRFHGTSISTLYNGMIHPIVPFALRGVLWYQGESNLLEKDGAVYANKQAALINSWRAAWGRELPFYFVQLPPLLYSARASLQDVPDAEPIFREAQAAALALPHTGMVVTTDIGALKNMHPPHKKEVGERLALWALPNDYGKKIEPSGPMYRSGSIEHEGYKAVLHFDHVDGGLVSSDGKPLDWFTTAGDDGKYYPAKAEISGDAIVITCPQVPEPKTVEFAWDEKAMPNFFNKAGLPAVPFRTDSPFGRLSRDSATPAH